MNLKLLKDANIKNKTILYRSPYDIGVKEVDGELIIKDDSRIRATIPTLKYLLNQNCKIVILTWVKRPEGKVVEKLRTIPHAKALQKLLGHPVKHVPDCIGDEVQKEIATIQPKKILFLENTRFYPEEAEDNDEFAKQLTKGSDLIVFDGFPQAHRKAASTTGILRHLSAVVGDYFVNEIQALSGVMDSPKEPTTLIVGGVKAETKIPIIEYFLDKADNILIGGKLPRDPLVEQYVDNPCVDIANLDESTMDIDKESIVRFIGKIEVSKTIIWAGPMGAFEIDEHAKGTEKIASAIAETGAYSLAAGGDTAEAVSTLNLTTKFDFVSLAGGATLEFLAGKKLAVFEYLIHK